MKPRLLSARKVGGSCDGEESTTPVAGKRIPKWSFTVHRSSPSHASVYEFHKWVRDGDNLIAEYHYVDTRPTKEAIDFVGALTDGLIEIPDE